MKRICDIVYDVMIETDNDSICSHDSGMLGIVASRAMMDSNGAGSVVRIQRRIMSALSRTPGPLIKGYTRGHRGNVVLKFTRVREVT